jgi:hypothetical protein
MPSTNGKIYFGASLVAEPGMQWEYDRPYPFDYGTTNTYTIPGSLIQTFTTSGTYTPGAGVTAVDVVVIGGGGQGGNRTTGGTTSFNGGGGSGGGVRVYRNVPVTEGVGVAVTVGGSGTESLFGALAAPGGNAAAYSWYVASGAGPGISPNGTGASAGGYYYYFSNTAGADLWRGQDGVLVNGTRYAGGGGSGGWSLLDSNVTGTGGAGGGGLGGRRHTANPPTAGTNGYGGGGGGYTYDSGGGAGPLGGSGRVMIYEVA